MSNQNNFITLTCVDSNGNTCSNLFLGTDANNNNHTINVSLDIDKLVEEKGVGIAEMQQATLTLRGDVVGQLQSCTAQYSTGEQSVVEYVAENGEVSLPIDLRPLLFAESPTLTLTNSNQQGGLQITDMSVNVTNTERKATYSVLPPTSIEPIIGSTAKIVTVENDTNTIVQSKRCDSEHTVYVDFNYRRKTSKKALKRLMLKVKLTGEGSGSLYVFNASNIGTEENPRYTSEVAYESTTIAQQIIENGNVYLLLDITNRLPTATGVLALVAKNNAYADFSGSVSFIEETVPYTDIMDDNAVLRNELGEKTKYEVDLLNGRLFVSTHLYAATGNLMPANLSLTYNEAYSDSPAVYGMPLFAKGWKLNYQQCIVFNDDNTCTYVDENFKERTFRLAENSTDVYYDFDGKSGLKIYKEKDNTYTLATDQSDSASFNEEGQLIALSKIRGDNEIQTTITYDKEGYPISICDGMNNTIVFETSKNATHITCNNVEIVDLTISENGELLGINCLETPSMELTYEDSKLKTLSDLLSKQGVNYAYDTADSVSKLVLSDFSDKDIVSTTRAIFFEYKALETTVSISQSNENKNHACFKTHYVFAENGEFLYAIENHSSALFSPVVYKNKDSYSQEIANRTSKYAQLKFGTATQTNIPVSINKPQNSTKVSASETFFIDNSSRTLIAGVQVKIDSPTIITQNEEVKIRVSARKQGSSEDSSSVYERFADLTQNKWQAFSIPIRQLESNQHYTITVEIVSNNLNSVVFVNNAYVAKYNGTLTADLIRVKEKVTPASIVSQPMYTEHLEDSDVRWYKMSDIRLKIDNNVAFSTLFTYKDYLLTLKSFSCGNPFNVFYNNGANMYCDAKSLSFSFDFKDISFEKVEMATMRYDDVLSFIHVSFLEDGYEQRVVRNFEKSDTEICIANSIAQYTPSGLLTNFIAENGTEIRYRYDAWGNCIEKKMLSKDETLNILFTSDYGTDGKHLISKTTYRNNETLENVYQYNNMGLLANETLANGQTINYGYDALAHLVQISSTVNNNINETLFSYTDNRISAAYHNSTPYVFSYDALGQLAEVTIGNTYQWSKETTLNADGTTQETIHYGNEQAVEKRYDKFGRVIIESELLDEEYEEVCYYIYSDEEISDEVTHPTSNTLRVSANSKLRRVIDIKNNIVYNYSYDAKDHLSSITQIDKDANGDTLNTWIIEVVEKNELGKTTGIRCKANGNTVFQKSEFSSDILKNDVETESTEDSCGLSFTTTYQRDALNRQCAIDKVESNTNSGYKTQVEYASRIEDGIVVGTTQYVSKATTQIIENGAVKSSKEENVSYDANGNITQYGTTTYEYDRLNRLVREDNLALNKTFTWAYDAGGNITSKKEYAYTTGELGNVLVEKPYTYGSTWKDQLVFFNGSAITYDQAGNPLTYKGNIFEWQRGKLLTKATLADGTVVNMTYYANGLRASKQLGNETHRYYYDPQGNLLQIVTHYATGGKSSMTFTYDRTGVTGFLMEGTYYYFVKNIFGDITDIYCGSNHVCHYTYDAWGSCLATNSQGEIISNENSWANINPFRYRGYYYDKDLKLYLLNSRLYDASTGRFVNANTFENLDLSKINGPNIYNNIVPMLTTNKKLDCCDVEIDIPLDQSVDISRNLDTIQNQDLTQLLLLWGLVASQSELVVGKKPEGFDQTNTNVSNHYAPNKPDKKKISGDTFKFYIEPGASGAPTHFEIMTESMRESGTYYKVYLEFFDTSHYIDKMNLGW